MWRCTGLWKHVYKFLIGVRICLLAEKRIYALCVLVMVIVKLGLLQKIKVNAVIMDIYLKII